MFRNPNWCLSLVLDNRKILTYQKMSSKILFPNICLSSCFQLSDKNHHYHIIIPNLSGTSSTLSFPVPHIVSSSNSCCCGWPCLTAYSITFWSNHHSLLTHCSNCGWCFLTPPAFGLGYSSSAQTHNSVKTPVKSFICSKFSSAFSFSQTKTKFALEELTMSYLTVSR